MRISYGRPAITFTISGTGTAFITPASALTNGRPADATRLQMTSTVTPVITDTVTITGVLASPINCGCCALLMPNIATAIPSGVKIQFAGKLSGTNVVLGGNAITARTVTLANGSTAIMCVFPAVSIDTIVMTIFNDRNGGTFWTASALYDIGEVWAGKVADFYLANDFETEFDGGNLQRQSHNNQAWPLTQQPYRSVTLNLQPMPEFAAIGPNSAQDDFETIMNAISVQPTVVVIEAYQNPGSGPTQNGIPPAAITTSTISAQRLARTFVLGVADQTGKMKRQADGNYWTSTIVIGETPP